MQVLKTDTNNRIERMVCVIVASDLDCEDVIAVEWLELGRGIN